MGNIIPFNEATKKDLAVLADNDLFSADEALVVSSGFPSLSIKGSKFAISKGGERSVIKHPDTGDTASSLDVVVVGFSPNIAKVFYKAQYEDGNTEAPNCYSLDGIKPASDAEAPQCKTCAACPHNKWGSAINKATGKKSKKCADVRRLAVSSPSQINEPMLLRVPPTSMKNLSEYQKMLSKRNVGIRRVVTKLSFDEDASSPLLHFAPVGLCDSEMLNEIVAINGEEIVKQITGEVATSYDVEDDTAEIEEETPPVVKEKPAPKKKATKKAAKKPEPEPEPEEVETEEEGDDDLFAQLEGFLDS